VRFDTRLIVRAWSDDDVYWETPCWSERQAEYEVVKTFISDPRVIEAAACLPSPIELVRFFFNKIVCRYRKAKIDEKFHIAEIRAEVNKLRSTLVTVWNGLAEMLLPIPEPEQPWMRVATGFDFYSFAWFMCKNRTGMELFQLGLGSNWWLSQNVAPELWDAAHGPWQQLLPWKAQASQCCWESHTVLTIMTMLRKTNLCNQDIIISGYIPLSSVWFPVRNYSLHLPIVSHNIY
jgi:hypothetical protein